MRARDLSFLRNILESGARSLTDISVLTGMSMSATRFHVRDLHEAKQIHVADWAKDTRGRMMVRLYRWGTQEDAARPAGATAIQRAIASRQRRRARQQHAEA
jgi:hypothetical protein